MKKLIIVLFALSLFSCSKDNEPITTDQQTEIQSESVIGLIFTQKNEYTLDLSIIEKNNLLYLNLLSSKVGSEETQVRIERQTSSIYSEVYFILPDKDMQVVVIRENNKIIAISYKWVNKEDNIFYLKE